MMMMMMMMMIIIIIDIIIIMLLFHFPFINLMQLVKKFKITEKCIYLTHGKESSCPLVNPIYKLTSMVWNISIGHFRLAACSLPALAHLVIC